MPVAGSVLFVIGLQLKMIIKRDKSNDLFMCPCPCHLLVKRKIHEIGVLLQMISRECYQKKKHLFLCNTPLNGFT
jgi:hypothetical protein